MIDVNNKTVPVYNLISDGDLSDELVACLRNRAIEQKFLYLEEGALFYYLNKGSKVIYKDVNGLKREDFWRFGLKNIFRKAENNSQKMVLISLGCGNSSLEKYLLKQVKDNCCLDCHYFGVDSSRKMLDLSIEKLKDLKEISVKYICADFSSFAFRREIDISTKKYNKRVFTFFSNTLGNINHTNIIDILSNILHSGEQIWLDVCLRSWLTNKDNERDIDKFHNFFKQQKKFFANFLNKLGISIDKGILASRTEKEKNLNALRFQFKFIFKERVKLKIKEEEIIITPEEEINLVQIYAYDEERLITFFKDHEFRLVDKQVKEAKGQFLFEKV